MPTKPFIRTLRAQWLGQQLRSLREERGLSLKMVAETTPPVVVAIPREISPVGFIFMTAVKAEPGDSDTDNISQTANIGMVYDTMAAKHEHKTWPSLTSVLSSTR